MAAKIGNVTADQLRSIIERIERLEEEKSNILSDVRDVYAEAKANGYDPKAIRVIVQLRKLDNHERDEKEYTEDLYKRALGMAPDLSDDDTPRQSRQEPQSSATHGPTRQIATY